MPRLRFLRPGISGILFWQRSSVLMRLTNVTAARTRRCWQAAIRSTNLAGRRAQSGGQAGRATGNQSARSGSIQSGLKPGAEDMGPQIAQPENG